MQGKIITFILLFGLGFVSASSTCRADTFASSDILKRITPSVVHISGYMKRESEEPYVEASGFFIENGGFLISVSNVFTNSETRRLCERFLVRLSDGRQLHASMFSVDPILNLILLEVTEPGPYPAVESDFAERVRPGEQVLAVEGGKIDAIAPFTVGFVKARHKRSIYGAGLGDMFIDSRIELPAGAYGGPLLDAEGRVIGVNTPNVHRPDPQNADPEESHALPMRIVNSFFKMSKTYPTSAQNWLGVAFRPLNVEEKNTAYDALGQWHGVLVDFVWADGPAAELDIQPGDILFSVKGTGIWKLHQLNSLLWHMKAGTLVELSLLRRGRELMRQVTLEKRPAWAGDVNWLRNGAAAGQTSAAAATDR